MTDYKAIIEKADYSKREVRTIGLINAVRYDKELDDHQKLDRIDTIVEAYNELNRKRFEGKSVVII